MSVIAPMTVDIDQLPGVARPGEASTLLRLCCGRASLETEAGGIDWPRLIALARRHRVVPLVYRTLKQPRVRVPSQIMEQWAGLYRRNAALAIQLTSALGDLLDRFAAAHIPAIAFKGPALAASVYGDLALREAGDLDLLVRRQDIVRAADLLESLGHVPIFPTSTPKEARYLGRLSGRARADYLRRHSEHHLVCLDSGVNVDLHWAIALPEFSLPIDIDGMWRRSETIDLAGHPVQSLSAEDLLLVLCVNGAKDCWERLDRVCDVAALLETAKLQWGRVFALAARAGAARIVHVGLLLASELLEADLPPDVASGITDDQPSLAIGAEIRQRFLQDDEPAPRSRAQSSFFHLWLRERWRDRAGYSLAHLRPNVGDFAALPLPTALSFLHYVIRPFRLLGRYGLSRGQHETFAETVHDRE